MAASAVAFGLLAVTGVALAGVDLAPRGPAVATPTPTPSPTSPAVALVATPAQTVIATTLRSSIATGWEQASSLTWTSGTPFDQPCGRPSVADSALSGSRVYDLGKNQQVLVTVATYSAGQGAVALNGWSTLLDECATGPGSVGRAPIATPGADGLVAWVRPRSGADGAASMMLWRRGDVLVSVTAPTSNPSGLAARATQVDTALLAVLAGRCADITSTLADAARSPWVVREAFTGLTAPLTVSVVPSPTPPGQPDAVPVPDTYTPQPLPSVSFPVRPLDPVWPADLPVPVGSPVAPVKPAPAPAVTAVPSRIDDPVGPGCGWAFTGQVRPPYDEAAEAVAAQARAQQAQDDLVARQAQWQSDTVAYWRDLPAYEAQAALFVAYAEGVRAVAAAWDTINAQRTAYAEAVTAYDAAVAARTDFLLRQDAARSAYEAAVTACGLTPSPLPTDPVAPDPSATGVPAPPFTPVPNPNDTITPGCPPEVPAILYEAPPVEPVAPTPPPDPRPSIPPTASPSPTG